MYSKPVLLPFLPHTFQHLRNLESLFHGPIHWLCLNDATFNTSNKKADDRQNHDYCKGNPVRLGRVNVLELLYFSGEIARHQANRQEKNGDTSQQGCVFGQTSDGLRVPDGDEVKDLGPVSSAVKNEQVVRTRNVRDSFSVKHSSIMLRA